MGVVAKMLGGTTSACAENTCSDTIFCRVAWNYLRVRGEYQEKNTRKHKAYGTTSACAENTCPRRG